MKTKISAKPEKEADFVETAKFTPLKMRYSLLVYYLPSIIPVDLLSMRSYNGKRAYLYVTYVGVQYGVQIRFYARFNHVNSAN